MTSALDVALLTRLAADAGIALPESAAQKLALHAAELLRWNRAIRLTAIVDPVEITVKHVLDSLLLLKFAPYPGRVLDAGSGAGYPGIPLAVALPESRVVLLDPVAKKCAFLSQVCRRIGLANASVVRGRIGRAPAPEIGQFDHVVSRATFPPEEALRVLAPYLLPGGRLLLMTGPGAECGELPMLLSPGRRLRFTLPLGMGLREIREYRAA